MTTVRHETVHYTAAEMAVKEAADRVAKAKRRKVWIIVIGVALAAMVFSCLGCLFMGSLATDKSVAPARATALIATVEVRETETAIAQAPIATATAQAAIGTSRSNPVPMGHVAVGGGMSLVITEVRRPAYLGEILSSTSYSPEPDNEYVVVYVMAECTLSPEEDEQCSLEPYEFELTGSSNLVREREWFYSPVDPDLLEGVEFYSGATVTGALAFQVAQGEDNLILIYEPFWSFLFENEMFFALQ